MSTIDNPGQSLFQGPDLNIHNSQNNEEDEDLEDQIRRQEELQNLLHEALDDFKYDDSTINSSSNVSVASIDDVRKSYRDALPSDQLKVLYEVKVREINRLRDEFDSFKADKKKEIDNLKNKLLLSEAEIRQLQLSNKNGENLLVEKVETINSYKKRIDVKDKEISTLNEIIEDYKIEVCTYKTTINELQLKIAESNPFKMGAKVFESEELQSAREAQVLRLESAIEEETKKSAQYEKEIKAIKMDLERSMELRDTMESEYKTQINLLIGNLDGAQAQCKDLVDVVEVLTKENEHFKERIQSYENNNPILSEESFHKKSLDYDTLLVQLEKLKRMLLDKSVENNTQKAKLRFYETDIKELLQYRGIKSEISRKHHTKCDQSIHIQDLLVMQNELKNLIKTIEDKDRQIENISAINRELQVKIEDTLRETRTEILNLSNKYNMPQLEALTGELKIAEEKIIELQREICQLKDDNGRLRISTSDLNQEKVQNLEKQNRDLQELIKEFKSDNTMLKSELKSSQESMKDQLKQFINNLQAVANGSDIDNPKVILLLKTEMEEFLCTIKESDVEKHAIEEKLSSWKKQLDYLKFVKKSPFKHHSQDKELYTLTLSKLDEMHAKVRQLEEENEGLTSAKVLTEGEIRTLEFQLKDCETKMNELNTENYKLTNSLTNLMQRQADDNNGQIENLKLQLKQREEQIESGDKEKAKTAEILERFKSELADSKKEIMRLEKELSEALEANIRRELQNELKEVEEELEQSKLEDDSNVMETEHFKKCLQAEILKTELHLHEQCQKEFENKLSEIEQKYFEGIKIYKSELEKTKENELIIRDHVGKIMKECGQKVIEMEVEKNNYLEELKQLQREYVELNEKALGREQEYKIVVEGVYRDAKNNAEKWKQWVTTFVSKWTKIEEKNKAARESIMKKIKLGEKQIAKIEQKTEARKLKATLDRL